MELDTPEDSLRRLAGIVLHGRWGYPDKILLLVVYFRFAIQKK